MAAAAQDLASFDCDAQTPFDLKQKGVEAHDGIEMRDIAFAGPKSGTVPAYLVVPHGKGPSGASSTKTSGRLSVDGEWTLTPDYAHWRTLWRV
jgi:hypothetical protein